MATSAAENNSSTIEALSADGWHLSPEKVLAEIEDFDKLPAKAALEELKNSDLRNIGVACFPDDVAKVRCSGENVERKKTQKF